MSGIIWRQWRTSYVSYANQRFWLSIVQQTWCIDIASIRFCSQIIKWRENRFSYWNGLFQIITKDERAKQLCEISILFPYCQNNMTDEIRSYVKIRGHFGFLKFHFYIEVYSSSKFLISLFVESLFFGLLTVWCVLVSVCLLVCTLAAFLLESIHLAELRLKYKENTKDARVSRDTDILAIWLMLYILHSENRCSWCLNVNVHYFVCFSFSLH